jgi:hypothetical protein
VERFVANEAKSALVPEMKLSFGGAYHRTHNKKFQETILLVPFFGGSPKQLHKHVEFCNDLGFDCVTYKIKPLPKRVTESLFSSKSTFGMKHVWADQIEQLLNEIPGRKIVFSFSHPSASAIEAIARRHAADINGLVCDSGPSGEPLNSIFNYFTFEDRISFLPLRWVTATISTLTWNPNFNSAIQDDLSNLPPEFRVLSIRGWKDKLISPHQIDKVFEPHTHLDWQKLSLPQAGHLNGLKDFPDEYKNPVQQFLKEIATSTEVES